MRISKALKSILYGVSTDDAKLRGQHYLAEQTNVQTVEGSGLHKRPPTKLINNEAFGWFVDSATHATILKSFVVQETLMYLQISYELADPSATPFVYIVDDEGWYLSQNIATSDYLADVTKPEDVEITVQEDTVFVLNKNKVISVDSTQMHYDTTSLILVERAPVVGSVLKISYTDTSGNPQSINYTVTSANGTNSVAIALANAINVAAHTGITAQTRGSVVAVLRTDNAYAEVSVEDEAGGTILEAINGEVQSTNTLPKYIPGVQLITVRPIENSDKGKFYLKAITTGQVSVPADPTKDVTLSAALGVLGATGYQDDPAYPAYQWGSVAPDPWVINSTTILSASTYLNTNTNQYEFAFWGGAGTDLSTPPVERITIKDSVTGASVGDGTPITFVSSSRTYLKLVGTSNLVAGRNYDIWVDAEFGVSNNLLQVKWEETLAPSIPNKLLETTMPHTIKDTPIVGYAIDPFDWDERVAGDEVTNPLPGFVGQTIQSLKIFQNRLVALYNENVATTETDNTRSWFRSTVTQLLATHPVNLRSTSPNSDKFHTALNHNKDLLLFSKASQFKLSGDVALTPETAGMPQTSSYVNTVIVNPISAGQNVYFAFPHGNYTGISRYTASEAENQPDNAKPITDHVNKYMLGTPNKLLSDANLGILYAIFDSEIYVCDFDARGEVTNETPRYAWSKWKSFAGDEAVTILESDLIGNKLQLAIQTGNNARVIQLDILQEPTTIAKTVYLDMQTESFVQGGGLILLPNNYPVDADTMRVIYAEGEVHAGAQIPWLNTGVDELTVTDVPDTTVVIIGHTFKASVVPSTIYIKDASGHVNSFAKLSIWKWLISLTNSADVTASINSNYYEIPDQHWSGLISYDINTTTNAVADNTALFDVGYNQQSELASLEISSDGHLPLNITNIEWEGKYSTRGKRF